MGFPYYREAADDPNSRASSQASRKDKEAGISAQFFSRWQFKEHKRREKEKVMTLSFFFSVRPHTKLLWKLSFLGLKIIVTFGGIFFLLVNWIWTCFMLLMILLQNLLKCLTYKYWVSCRFLALSSNWHGRSGCKDAVSYWPWYVGLCLIHMVLLWWPSLDFDWCHWRCISNSNLSQVLLYIS